MIYAFVVVRNGYLVFLSLLLRGWDLQKVAYTLACIDTAYDIIKKFKFENVKVVLVLYVVHISSFGVIPKFVPIIMYVVMGVFEVCVV